jgi:hypothetical protein
LWRDVQIIISQGAGLSFALTFTIPGSERQEHGKWLQECFHLIEEVPLHNGNHPFVDMPAQGALKLFRFQLAVYKPLFL